MKPLLVTLVLVTVALAQQPDAPSKFWTNQRIGLMAADAGAHAMDAYFTQRNFTNRNPQEHDPMVRPFVTHGTPLLALYFAGDTGIDALLAYALHRWHHNRLANLLLVSSIGSSTYGATTSALNYKPVGARK